MATPWQLKAKCRGEPVKMFFQKRTDHWSKNRPALALCENCPVKEPCLEMALADPMISGVWGGTTSMGRKQIRKQRKETNDKQ